MKQLLFVYDRMMTGGTTTALISLLRTIDYTKYNVDLLLYRNRGAFLKEIPAEVNLLQEAHCARMTNFFSLRFQKLVLGFFDGSLFNALKAYLKYKNTEKGNLKTILFHFLAKPQVKLSRKLSKKKYYAAIGFIEGWSDNYVVSKKINAERRIVWVHPDYKNSYLIPEADNSVFKKADNIVVVSDNCKKNLCEIFPEYADKSITIENIVSAEYLKFRSEEEKINIQKHSVDMCTVCRCDILVKGLDRVVNVLAKLKAEGFLGDAHWHLIGGGELPVLRNMINDKGIGDNVTLYGHKDNPLVYLKEMDVFVLASRYEGKPVSVAEALALGIPCVVTEYSSAREQVSDSVNGIVVENSEEGLYEGIKKILVNMDLLKTFKEELLNNRTDNSGEINKLYNMW